MDLGLNNVLRKFCVPVDETAHMLIAVPGEPIGPGGLIVVCENFLVYKKVDHEDREVPIPRRNDMSEGKGLFMTCAATHYQKDLFFIVL